MPECLWLIGFLESDVPAVPENLHDEVDEISTDRSSLPLL